jgi:hypothetical protein
MGNYALPSTDSFVLYIKSRTIKFLNVETLIYPVAKNDRIEKLVQAANFEGKGS